MGEPIRVLVVDDQPRARQSLKALLATYPSIAEVREAVDGREALKRIEESQPDVVLMDVLMPELDGLEATRQIKARWQQVKVIVLSMYGEYATGAQAVGADDFVSKGEPPAKLLAVLAAVTKVGGPPSDNTSNLLES